MLAVAAPSRRGHRDGGAIRVPVTAAAAIDPTDGDLARALRRPRWSPSQRLWAAVLWEVLVDLRKYAPPLPQARAARAWLESDDTGWPLAFRPLCDVLGLEPVAVRTHVLRRLPQHSDCVKTDRIEKTCIVRDTPGMVSGDGPAAPPARECRLARDARRRRAERRL
jgi:hypothetical protein